MKNILMILSALILSNLSYADSNTCLENYQASSNPEVIKAAAFLREALDDFDYQSMDDMVLSIRKDLGLPKYSGPTEDPLNVEIGRIIGTDHPEVLEASPLCQGEPWTLAKIEAYLVQKLRDSLPSSF